MNAWIKTAPPRLLYDDHPTMLTFRKRVSCPRVRPGPVRYSRALVALPTQRLAYSYPRTRRHPAPFLRSGAVRQGREDPERICVSSPTRVGTMTAADEKRAESGFLARPANAITEPMLSHFLTSLQSATNYPSSGGIRGRFRDAAEGATVADVLEEPLAGHRITDLDQVIAGIRGHRSRHLQRQIDDKERQVAELRSELAAWHDFMDGST